MTDEELTAAIREVQRRARARAPQGPLGLDGVEAADLMPLVHARDAAQAKVAAIGTVNPRPPGLMNATVQNAKRAVARALDWHVREQVEFNRAAIACVEASIEAMTGMSRSLAAMAHQSADRAAARAAAHTAEEAWSRQLQQYAQQLEQHAQQLDALRSLLAGTNEALVRQSTELEARVEARIEARIDTRMETGAVERLVETVRQEQRGHAEALRLEQAARFEDWRTEHTTFAVEMDRRLNAFAANYTRLEQTMAAREVQMSQTVASLETTYQQLLARQETVFREFAQSQHQDYARALEQNTIDVQKRLWDDLVKVREEFEGLIHRELRLLRQRDVLPAGSGVAIPVAPESQAAMGIDWLHFSERFRGSEERIRTQQQRYAQRFAGTTGTILDIGCGRGEFLEALRDAGLTGMGVDANAECVEMCLSKGLAAEWGDVFTYLDAQEDGALGGVYCAQVVEHLAPAQVANLVHRLGAKVRAGGWVAIETPNPDCLAIFATYFYADPTHTRPVPAALLRFYLEEAGFGSIVIEHLNPAVELLPAIATLPEGVRESLFGGLDYAVFARKL